MNIWDHLVSIEQVAPVGVAPRAPTPLPHLGEPAVVPGKATRFSVATPPPPPTLDPDLTDDEGGNDNGDGGDVTMRDAVPAAPDMLAQVTDSDDDDDDSEDDSDDDDDAEHHLIMTAPAAAQPQVTLSNTASFRHNFSPAPNMPDTWPVFEAYALNVPTNALGRCMSDSERTWGRFGNTETARSSKRLLFLLFRAMERALQSPACDPLRQLPPADAVPAVRVNQERALQRELAENNPQGMIQRPPGVGGALVRAPSSTGQDGQEQTPDDVLRADPGLAPIQRMITHTDPSQVMFARDTHDTGDSNTFVFKMGAQGEPILARRFSVCLEELLGEQGGDTVGWRWWILVHDPRICFARWIARVVNENLALETARSARVDHALRSGRPLNRSLRDSVSTITSPGCYRAIRTINDYARAVRYYYRSGTAGTEGYPRSDSAAMAYGLSAQGSSMHPCRVFSPATAMNLHVRDRTCIFQTSLKYYANRQTNLLGQFVRAARTTMYNVALLTPNQLHELPLPNRDYRSTIIRDLMWEGLQCSVASLPAQLRDAMQQDGSNLRQIMEIWEEMEENAREVVRGLMTSLVDEYSIESRELALLRDEHDGPPRSRRRLNRHDHGFERDGDDDDDDDDDDAAFIPDGFDEDRDLSANAARQETGSICVERAYDPEGTVDASLFAAMKQAEEAGSSITENDVLRSPLLHLRMCNNWSKNLIRQIHEPNTPEYRAAFGFFRQWAFGIFWNTLQKYKDDPVRMSGPIRGALKLLQDVNRSPNFIPRHYAEIEKARRERERERERERQNDAFSGLGSLQQNPQSDLFMTAVLQREGMRNSSSSRNDRHNSHLRVRQGRNSALRFDPRRPKPGATLWHEWAFGPARNLTAYGAYTCTLWHKLVQFFRVRPGAGPDLLRRLIIAQGTAWVFNWGLHGDQLLWGPGGVGKSYMLLCIFKQAFPGQAEFLDHLTEKCFAVDEDMNDLLILIEELHPRFVGQDEKGNPVGGDELLKTLLARHYIATIQTHVTDDGKRVRMRSIARSMLTIFGCTNLVIRMLRNGVTPAILRRWMMDHVGCGKDNVSLAAINNPLSIEHDSPEQLAFYHEMQLRNALCLLVEKMIEAKVLEDIDTDVCAFHFPWFFDQVHKQCRVPKVSDSVRKMLVQLCRQEALRYAIHRVFFTETAANGIRCRKRPGCTGESPEDWEPRPFEPNMLLQVQPFLVVTEEIMVYVLTTARSTYMPTVSWGVADVLAAIGVRNYRKTTRQVLEFQQQHEQETANAANTDIDMDPNASESPDQEEEEEEEEEHDPYMAVQPPPPPQPSSSSASSSGISIGDGLDMDRVVQDRNYVAFVKPDLKSACNYFARLSRNTIGSLMFKNTLKQWEQQYFAHADRNRPRTDPQTGDVVRDPVNDREYYDHYLESPIVVCEPVPLNQHGGWGNAGLGGGGGSGGGGGDRNQWIQVCILIEFLEQKRHSDINEILKKGLSYRGARKRDIVTAQGVRRVKPVTNPFDQYASLNTSTTNPPPGPKPQQPVVVQQYLNVIPIEPDTRMRLSRINHFPESDITDSIVFNRSFEESPWPPTRQQIRQDKRRYHQLFLDADLNQLLITEYWHRAGLEVRSEWYPWNHTQTMRRIAEERVDGTNTPTRNRVHEHYPNSYCPTEVRIGAADANAVVSDEQIDAEMDADMDASNQDAMESGSLGDTAQESDMESMNRMETELTQIDLSQPLEFEGDLFGTEPAAHASSQFNAGPFGDYLRRGRKRYRESL